ncbi:MAG: hypothetical protein ACJ74Y_00650 [Bryobacteraceae bacterium]
MAAIVSGGEDGPEATHVPVVLHEDVGRTEGFRATLPEPILNGKR